MRGVSSLVRPGGCGAATRQSEWSGRTYEYPHEISGVSKSPFAAHAAEAIAVFWTPLGDPGLVPAAAIAAQPIGLNR